jgi:hypothetical protein
MVMSFSGSRSGRNYSDERVLVLFRELFDVAGAIAGHVDGVTFGEEFLVRLAEKFVSEFQGAVLGFQDACAHDE